MVSGVFGMFFIHRKRTASLPLSETAPFFIVFTLRFFVKNERKVFTNGRLKCKIWSVHFRNINSGKK